MAYFDRAPGSAYEHLDELFSACVWTEPAWASALRFAADGRRVYAYHFTRACPAFQRSDELAKHTAEIRYVFGTLSADGSYDDIDQALSRTMQQAWTTFAATGAPGPIGGAAWPGFTSESPRRVRLEEAPAIEAYAPGELLLTVHSLRQA